MQFCEEDANAEHAGGKAAGAGGNAAAGHQSELSLDGAQGRWLQSSCRAGAPRPHLKLLIANLRPICAERGKNCWL